MLGRNRGPNRAAWPPPRTASPKTRTIVAETRDLEASHARRPTKIEVRSIAYLNCPQRPVAMRSSAPRLGGDTDAVLAELGLATPRRSPRPRARNVVA